MEEEMKRQLQRVREAVTSGRVRAARLAKVSGVRRNTLSLIVNDITQAPTPRTLDRLVNALDQIEAAPSEQLQGVA